MRTTCEMEITGALLNQGVAAVAAPTEVETPSAQQETGAEGSCLRKLLLVLRRFHDGWMASNSDGLLGY